MHSSGKGPLDPRSYVHRGRILISRLGRRGVAAIVAAFFSGTLSLLLSITDLPLALLSGLASFLGTYYRTWGEALALLASGSITAAADTVLAFDIFAFVLSAVIVASAAYAFQVVVSRAV
jgi:hypothetical protein